MTTPEVPESRRPAIISIPLDRFLQFINEHTAANDRRRSRLTGALAVQPELAEKRPDVIAGIGGLESSDQVLGDLEGLLISFVEESQGRLDTVDALLQLRQEGAAGGSGDY